jgi:hypothetical protein
MDSRNRDENRADFGRVLLALIVLALLSQLDSSGAAPAAVAAHNASGTAR